MKRNYIDLTRGQMHYRQAGQGAPLLLLHMSGSSSDEYEQAGNLLSQHYQVFAPDFFGFGSSDVPPRYLSFREHMQAIYEFCERLGLSSILVVGNLVGANIACHLAAEHPKLVKGLILFQVCYHPDPSYYRDRRDTFSQIPITEDGSHLREIWARANKYGESAPVTDRRAACLHAAGAFGEALHWALCEDEDFHGVLAKISGIPSSVLAYRAMGSEGPRQAATLIASSHFQVLNATPYFSRANPQGFCKTVLEMLP